MKVSPPSALNRLAQRFQERRARAAMGERPPLTEDDEANILGFGQIVDELTRLLLAENNALRQGDVGRVAEMFEGKQGLLKKLETRQPVVEPFLRESAEVTAQLRDKIRGLGDQLEQNGSLLSSMAEAAQSIRTEVARVRDRHSLKGMYDKSGQSRPAGGARPRQIDTKF